MRNPRFEIDLNKIFHNVQTIVDACRQDRIDVVGVTKAVCASPEITRLLLAAGVKRLADSRLQNVIKLRKAGIKCEIGLLRIPMISEAYEAVQFSDFSYHSELKVIEAFDRAAKELKKVHRIILMIEMGDLREGILPEELEKTAKRIQQMRNIQLSGLAMNVGCYGGVLPTFKNTSRLVSLCDEISQRCNIHLPVISGGSTSTLKLMEQGKLALGVNEIRVGEGIYLGTGASAGGTIPGAHTDAFRLVTEIVELKEKPSVPMGVINKDAFGRVPYFTDKGIRKRAIVAIGRQDVATDGLLPLEQGMEIVGESSDHLIVDVTECKRDWLVGDEVEFLPNYGGLLALMTSPYVKKITRAENINTFSAVSC